MEWRIAGLLLFFVGLHCSMLALKRAGLLSEVLASRPTLVANQLHCTSVLDHSFLTLARELVLSRSRVGGSVGGWVGRPGAGPDGWMLVGVSREHGLVSCGV